MSEDRQSIRFSASNFLEGKMDSARLRKGVQQFSLRWRLLTAVLSVVLLTSTQFLARSLSSVGEERENPPQQAQRLLAATYYSFADNFRSTLMLVNQGPNPLEVQVTLFSLAGERLDPPPITMEGNGFRVVDLAELVGKSARDFKEGSLQVLYRGKDLQLGAVVQLLDADRSLIFDEELVELSTAFSSSRLEGVWWRPSEKHRIRLVVSNTSDSPVSVTTSVFGTTPIPDEVTPLYLGPHETRVVVLQQHSQTKREASAVGGISIEHSGPKGAVMARGLIQRTSEGYSSVVELSDPEHAKSAELHGAGLRVDGAGGEALLSVAVARNVGRSDTVLTGRIPYTAEDGSTAQLEIPEVHLVPGEAKILDLTRATSGIPDKIASAGLEFRYSGEPGSVVMAALSTAASGNHVFRVPLVDPATLRSSTGGYPWMIEGDSSTVVYIKNVTDSPQRYTLQMSVNFQDFSPTPFSAAFPHPLVARHGLTLFC